MQLLRGDADLGAQAEHAAIGERGGGVHIHRGRINFVDEPLDGRRAFGEIRIGDDGLGMHRAVTVDMGDSLFGAANAAHGQVRR